MSISSQAQQQCWEGSETRVNDLSHVYCAFTWCWQSSQRCNSLHFCTFVYASLMQVQRCKKEINMQKIMKLHERLEEIKNFTLMIQSNTQEKSWEARIKSLAIAYNECTQCPMDKVQAIKKNILMHPFHMLGVAGVFGGSLFSAMHKHNCAL